MAVASGWICHKLIRTTAPSACHRHAERGLIKIHAHIQTRTHIRAHPEHPWEQCDTQGVETEGGTFPTQGALSGDGPFPCHKWKPPQGDSGCHCEWKKRVSKKTQASAEPHAPGQTDLLCTRLHAGQSLGLRARVVRFLSAKGPLGPVSNGQQKHRSQSCQGGQPFVSWEDKQPFIQNILQGAAQHPSPLTNLSPADSPFSTF